MTFDIETKSVFIPKIGGNNKKSQEEQMRVYIIRPNAEQLADLSSMDIIKKMSTDDFSKFSENKGKKEETIFRPNTKTGKAIRNHVEKIENLKVRESGVVRDITTGEELLKLPSKKIKDLIDEIVAEILRDELTEKKLKN